MTIDGKMSRGTLKGKQPHSGYKNCVSTRGNWTGLEMIQGEQPAIRSVWGSRRGQQNSRTESINSREQWDISSAPTNLIIIRFVHTESQVQTILHTDTDTSLLQCTYIITLMTRGLGH